MKKLLLILLCLPMIGFGQKKKKKGISFDILLKDKGNYIVEWSNLLGGNDNIDPQYGFIYPLDEKNIILSSKRSIKKL